MIFKKRDKCFMCNKPVDKDGATLKFKHLNAEANAEISDLNLCKKCGDFFGSMERVFNDNSEDEE